MKSLLWNSLVIFVVLNLALSQTFSVSAQDNSPQFAKQITTTETAEILSFDIATPELPSNEIVSTVQELITLEVQSTPDSLQEGNEFNLSWAII